MSEKRGIDKEKLKMHISVMRGLIGYHERITLPHGMACAGCGYDGCVESDLCAALANGDVHLQALKFSLLLLEEEFRLRFPDMEEELGRFAIEPEAGEKKTKNNGGKKNEYRTKH